MSAWIEGLLIGLVMWPVVYYGLPWLTQLVFPIRPVLSFDDERERRAQLWQTMLPLRIAYVVLIWCPVMIWVVVNSY